MLSDFRSTILNRGEAGSGVRVGRPERRLLKPRREITKVFTRDLGVAADGKEVLF